MASWLLPAPRAAVDGRRAAQHGEVALTAQEVLAAVRSLYFDELKPTGRMIRKRVHELATEAMLATVRRMCGRAAAADVRVAPPPDPSHVLRVCLDMGLCVVQETDTEFAAYLPQQPRAEFVDIDSPVDPYPEALWSALAAHLASLKGGAALLPRSRYLCAQALASQRLKCLRGRSLGQLCHIVGLALHQRRLLGFADDCVVPLPQDAPALEVASLKEAQRGLLELMRRHGGSSVSEDAVHSWFRRRFGKDLSMAKLGFASLADFLCDLREKAARHSKSRRPAPGCASPPVPPGLLAEQTPPPASAAKGAFRPPPGLTRAEAAATSIPQHTSDVSGVAKKPKVKVALAPARRHRRRILTPIAEEVEPTSDKEECWSSSASSGNASTACPMSPRSDPEEPAQVDGGDRC